MNKNQDTWIKRILSLLVFLLIFFGMAYIGMEPDFSDLFVSKDEKDISDEKNVEVIGDILVHFIDVGQGKSILIQKEEKGILIDGGEREYGDRILDYFNKVGVNSLSLVIATHPHADHIGGLPTVLKNIPVNMVWMPDVIHTTATYENLVNTIIEKEIPVDTPKVGSVFEFYEGELFVLSPENPKEDDLNNASIVTHFSYGENSFLFTGDVEKEIEKEILNTVSLKGYPLESVVLDVPHHGSHTSSSKEFIERIHPSYAVFSLGKDNSYGHPHKEILERYEDTGATILRTDINGDIVFSCNGENIEYLPNE